MATDKTKVRLARNPRPDRYSKKKKGNISQSLRISVDDAKLIREASVLRGESTNHWMQKQLINAAKRQLAAANKQKVSMTIGEDDSNNHHEAHT